MVLLEKFLSPNKKIKKEKNIKYHVMEWYKRLQLVMIPRASPWDEWKSWSQFLHSFVDASRLDLSSPFTEIRQDGFDESNPYNQIEDKIQARTGKES